MEISWILYHSDFTWNQFWGFLKCKISHFTTFRGSEFWFLWIFALFEGWFLPNEQNSQPLKRQKYKSHFRPHFSMLAKHIFRPANFLSIFVLILVCWLPPFLSSHFAIHFRLYFSMLATTIFGLPFCYQFSFLFQYAGYNHFHPPILVSIIVLIVVC